MAKKNRDDFSESVKIKAAKRTGYRCSFCSISTIGPSYESSEATASIGEAAHICAAAPGGKRYDPTMTPEQRSSIDNCIWMCKTHARLIDRDETKYTVETLKAMKRKAEKFAEKEISELDIYRKSYNEGEDDTNSLHNTFRKLVEEGSYDLLRNMLESYTTTISPVYDELVLRFQIIFALHCNRSLLPGYVGKYIELPLHSGIDEILSYAIPFEQKDAIADLLPFSTDSELQKICQLILDDCLEKSLIGKPDDQQNALKISKDKEWIINSYIIQKAVDKKMFYIRYVDGTNIQCASSDKYFKLLFAAFTLGNNMVTKGANITYDPGNSEYWTLTKNVEIINQLDYCLQEYLWEILLQFTFEDKDRFDKLILDIPLCVAELPRVTKHIWLYKLHYDFSGINIDELLAFSEKTEDYALMSRYLWMIPEQKRYDYIKDHLYLCRKCSSFLDMIDRYEGEHNVCTIDIKQYSVEMQDDFLYHCLCYKHAADATEKEAIISWLLDHQGEVKLDSFKVFIDILADANKWDRLVELSTRCVYNHAQYYIANKLVSSKDRIYVSKALQIFNRLESAGWKTKGLCYNIAVVSVNTGKTETAKKYFKKEFDLYRDQTALYHFLRLRIDTHDVSDDEYLLEAKNILTVDFQSIVAASYDKLKKHDEVKKYVLRALLLDDSAACLGALCSPYRKEEVRVIDCVQEDTVCVLVSPTTAINVAIHNDGIIQHFEPNHFADCFHFSIGDSEISPLLFSKCNDVVTFQSNEYTVSKIIPTSAFFSAYAMQRLIAEGRGVETINAQDPTAFLEQIKICLRNTQQKQDAIISEYNAAQIRYPISVLSALLSQVRIDICGFLAYGNEEKTRNNTHIHQQRDDTVFVLSYDAIINLAMMSAFPMIPAGFRIMCPYQVKKQILGDVIEILDDICSKNSAGSLFLVDDKPVFSERTADFKRARHAYLSTLKSFVSAFPDLEAYDYESDQEEITAIFTEKEMGIEAGTLALLQNTPNAILVTDDEFLYSFAKMIGRESVGLLGFLSSINSDSQQLLSISKKAKEINFANYIPLFLFDKIVDSLTIIQEQDEMQKTNDDLIKWLLSDRDDDDASDYHRNLILQLYRDCVAQVGGPLSTDYPLTQIAIHHFAVLNPDVIRQAVEEFARNIEFTIVDSSDEGEECKTN